MATGLVQQSARLWNLSPGHRAAVQPGADFAQLDLAQTDELARLMRHRAVTSVLLFAALAYVGESVERPGRVRV
jgi:UDP-glucose 4-epimerase